MKSFFLSFLLLLGSVVLCCSSSLIEPNETLNKGFLSNITQHLKHLENSTSRCNKSETYIGCSYNSGYITYDFGQRPVNFLNQFFFKNKKLDRLLGKFQWELHQQKAGL